MNLLVDGQPVRTATGPNDRPGGSERLDWHQWDVSDFAGKTASIQIVDQATGGWGHINVDHIVQTDHRLPGLLTGATARSSSANRYLNLPVKTGAPKQRVSLLVDGVTVREFEIELAGGQAGLLGLPRLGAVPGQEARAIAGGPTAAKIPAALKSIEQADDIKGAENLYHET